jgi:translation elongation factor EF-Tu-like GTPase
MLFSATAILEIGGQGSCSISLLLPGDGVQGKGLHFAIREGGRTVGSGKVARILE